MKKWISPFLLAAALMTFGCSSNEPPHTALQISAISEPVARSASPFVIYVEPLHLPGHVSLESRGESAGAYDVSKILGLKTQYEPRDYLYQQFITVLLECPELSIVDKHSVKELPGGAVQIPLKQGERGPYIARVTITEMNPGAVIEQSSFNTDTPNGVNILLGAPIFLIAHVIQSNTGIPIPTGYRKDRTVSALAMDISLIDGKTGTLIRSFSTKGTWAEEGAKIKQGFATMVGRFASSTMPQAVAVALVSAREKLLTALRSTIPQKG